MYHEKIGVFRDDDGQVVAFSGSANESRHGLSLNFERVEVFGTWWSEADRQRARRLEQHFQDLWTNQTEGLKVMDLALAELLADWRTNGAPHLLGAPPTADDLVVPSRKGAMRDTTSVRRRLHAELRRLYLRECRIHDARRTFVTPFRAAGARPDVPKTTRPAARSWISTPRCLGRPSARPSTASRSRIRTWHEPPAGRRAGGR